MNARSICCALQSSGSQKMCKLKCAYNEYVHALKLDRHFYQELIIVLLLTLVSMYCTFLNLLEINVKVAVKKKKKLFRKTTRYILTLELLSKHFIIIFPDSLHQETE